MPCIQEPKDVFGARVPQQEYGQSALTGVSVTVSWRGAGISPDDGIAGENVDDGIARSGR